MRRLSGEFMGTIQAELKTIEQETGHAVGGSGEEKEALTSLSGEFVALGHDTRQAISKMAANTDSVLKGEREALEEGRNG